MFMHVILFSLLLVKLTIIKVYILKKIQRVSLEKKRKQILTWKAESQNHESRQRAFCSGNFCSTHYPDRRNRRHRTCVSAARYRKKKRRVRFKGKKARNKTAGIPCTRGCEAEGQLDFQGQPVTPNRVIPIQTYSPGSLEIARA